MLNLLFKTRSSVLSFVLRWSPSVNVVCLIRSELYNLVNPRSLVVTLDHDSRVQGAALTESVPPRGGFLRTRSNPSGVSSIPCLRSGPFNEYLPVIRSSPRVTIAGIVTRLPPFRYNEGSDKVDHYLTDCWLVINIAMLVTFEIIFHNCLGLADIAVDILIPCISLKS